MKTSDGKAESDYKVKFNEWEKEKLSEVYQDATFYPKNHRIRWKRKRDNFKLKINRSETKR